MKEDQGSGTAGCEGPSAQFHCIPATLPCVERRPSPKGKSNFRPTVQGCSWPMGGLHCEWNSSDPRVLSVAWHPLCFLCPGSWRPLWLLTCSDARSPARPALTHLIPTPSWLTCYHFERRGPYPTARVRKVSISCTLDPTNTSRKERRLVGVWTTQVWA